MCTAIKFNENFFGRTLDFERSFGEEIIITPRERARLLLSSNRYAMVGVGVVMDGAPLYFDAVNEWGLSAAALNFTGFAHYSDRQNETSVKSSELISFILGLCRSVSEARDMLKNVNITLDKAHSDKPSGLHWMLADRGESIVIEPMADRLHIYDNPVGVMTNAPEFSYHMTRLADFSSLEASNPESRFTHSPLYSRGMGAIGLPGDFSSSSRFVRATFIKENLSLRCNSHTSQAAALIGVLGCMAVPRGSVLTDEGEAVMTLYSSVMDMDEPCYYLSTSTCPAVKRVRLNDDLCQGKKIICLPIYTEEKVIDLI